VLTLLRSSVVSIALRMISPLVLACSIAGPPGPPWSSTSGDGRIVNSVASRLLLPMRLLLLLLLLLLWLRWSLGRGVDSVLGPTSLSTITAC
jgi:hypothetical protein